MSRRLQLTVALTLGWAAAVAAASYDAVGKTALDGDSVVVELPSGLEVEVRLLSVDCPERARKKDPSVVVRWLRYEDHLIVGNRRSRVAHWPACRHVEEMKPENRVRLGTVAEARQLGYRMERGYR